MPGEDGGAPDLVQAESAAVAARGKESIDNEDGDAEGSDGSADAGSHGDDDEDREGDFDVEETKSRFTEYSMSSSVLPRSKGGPYPFPFFGTTACLVYRQLDPFLHTSYVYIAKYTFLIIAGLQLHDSRFEQLYAQVRFGCVHGCILRFELSPLFLKISLD